MFAASEALTQVFYALYDQRAHGPHPLGVTTTELLAETQREVAVIPHVPGTSWQLCFGHLFGCVSDCVGELVGWVFMLLILLARSHNSMLNGRSSQHVDEQDTHVVVIQLDTARAITPIFGPRRSPI